MDEWRERIKLKINMPFFKVELEGDPGRHIPELRKLISELNKISLTDLEVGALEELLPSMSFPAWRLSRELQKNDKLMSTLSQMSQLEEGVAVKKVSIENVSEVSESRTLSRINIAEIKKAVSKLFFDVDVKKISFALVHAMGNIPDENFEIIFDQIKRQLPASKVDTLKTKKEILGKTLVECVIFGNFPEERIE